MIAASAAAGGRELSDRVIGLSPDVISHPFVATNGTNALIVWRTSAGIVGSFLTKSGQRIGTVFTITNVPVPQAIVSVGSDYVLFAMSGDLYAITISGDGTKIGAPKIVASNAISQPARAVANGDRILVAYSTSNRPSPSCVVVDRNGDQLSEPQELGGGEVVSVAQRGTGFVALVVGPDGLFVLSRISSDGNVAFEASLALPGNYPRASLAVAASATNPDDTLIAVSMLRFQAFLLRPSCAPPSSMMARPVRHGRSGRLATTWGSRSYRRAISSS